MTRLAAALCAVVLGAVLQAEAAQQAPGELSLHNYQNVFPGARTVTLPVKVEDLKHATVYKTDKGPKWSCWTSAWLTPEGHIRVGFVDMSGAPADPKPSYGYEYAHADVLRKQGIKRCWRWCESRDGGATWRPIREIDASDTLAPQMQQYLLLKDRSLLGIGGVWHEWDFTKNTYICYGHTMAWLSKDNGTSWSKSVSLNDPSKTESFCCRPKQLSDGTIVVPAYGTLDRQGKGKGLKLNTDAWLYLSKDGGKSWSEPLVLARGQENRSNDEPDLVELAGGDLLVILRHANPKAKGGLVYLNCGQIIVNKTPEGWRVGPVTPTKLAFRGFPSVLRTREGVLICAGSGNQFNFSVDEGKTWSDTATILDPAVARPNHYPALLELPDGRILSVYHVGNHWPYPPPQDEWIHATSFRVKR
ncbi:MAG: exo-alpha-sialidase [Phycisphaerae bacterium]|nr:exo-alpha-sialidase [Phycisphaerae bacterium]